MTETPDVTLDDSAPREGMVQEDAVRGSPQTGYRFSRRVVVLSEPDSAAATGIRSLQTHLMAGHLRDGRRGMAICSPDRHAGCTTVAVNLAVACAQAGIKTLLIDANLCHPGVAQFIRPPAPTGGLCQMLTSDLDVPADEIHRQVLPNLSLLYAGSGMTGFMDLIATRDFKRLFDDCMRDYEFTIVDTPSGASTTDTRRVALAMRYALLIGRRDQTLMSAMKKLIEELSTDRVRFVGTFMTDI